MALIWDGTAGYPSKGDRVSSHAIRGGMHSSSLWAVVGLIIVVSTLWRWRRTQRRGLPPGPAGWPVVGNLLQLTKRGPMLHVNMARLAAEHGPVVFLRLGSAPAVVASSAAAAREFLHAHDRAFASRPPSQVSRSFQYGPAAAFALAPYGPHWRDMRRLCALHLFSAKRVLQFQPLRREEVRLLVHSLLAHRPPAAPVDLTRAISSTLENLVCRMLLRRRFADVAPALPSGQSRITSVRQAIHEGTYLFQLPIIGDFIPYLAFLDWKAKKSMRHLHAHLDAFWESLISERERAHQHQGDNLLQDILDILLRSCPSRDAIKTCLLDLLAAGMETTSATADWAMAELFANPPVLQKLQHELVNVVGMLRMVEESDLPNLPYLRATVKETLRLHPPAPLLLPHMSTEASEVMGYTLPKGTRLFVNVWAIGRDPDVWKEPERFAPDRFLDDPTIDVQGKHFELLPFGSGRRTCPAIPFALPTIQLVVSNLVHCFEWHLPAGLNIDMSEKPGSTVSRKEPLLAVPSPRLHL